MAFLPICRYADIGDCQYADILWIQFTEKGVDMAQNADIQISAISALKMFADNRYADIEKKCRYADIADADTSLLKKKDQ